MNRFQTSNFAFNLNLRRYALVATVMAQDWSWSGPAVDYVEAYWKAHKSAQRQQ